MRTDICVLSRDNSGNGGEDGPELERPEAGRGQLENACNSLSRRERNAKKYSGKKYMARP